MNCEKSIVIIFGLIMMLLLMMLIDGGLNIYLMIISA